MADGSDLDGGISGLHGIVKINKVVAIVRAVGFVAVFPAPEDFISHFPVSYLVVPGPVVHVIDP